MIFRRLISIVIFAIINNCKVNAYCNQTTQLTDTRVQTIQKTVSMTTTKMIYLTSTILSGTCKTLNGLSGIYGVRDMISYKPFTAKLSELTSILIYSGVRVNAIGFNFKNGLSEIYGNPVEQETLIDLANKEVIGINIRSYEVIISIQFLINDSNYNTIVWTRPFGGTKGNSLTTDPESISDKRAKNFKITSISGSANKTFVNDLKFEYSYEICNPSILLPPRPSIPPVPIVTTTIATMPVSTTVVIGQCKTFSAKSDTFGTIGTPYFLTNFNVRISSLKSIEVFSGEYVYKFRFNFNNGSSESHGYSLKKNIKTITTIDLNNKQIAAIHIRAGLWINNVQFLIYDPSNNTYTWTAALGGQGGDPAYIDAQTLAPFSSNFLITSLDGCAHPSDLIRTLRVGYIHTECDPVDPKPKVPNTPPLLRTTTTPHTVQTTTVNYVNNNGITKI